MHEGCGLVREHAGLRGVTVGGGEVAAEIGRIVERLRMENRWWVVREMRGLQCVGQQVFRLWCVQRGVEKVSERREVVLERVNERVERGVEKGMFGNEELDWVEGFRVAKGMFGLGIVCEKFGANTALAWLSGAEDRISELE